MSISWLYRKKKGEVREEGWVYCTCLLENFTAEETSCHFHYFYYGSLTSKEGLPKRNQLWNTIFLWLTCFIFIFYDFFAGLKGVAASTSPWVWGEPSTFCSCWENGGQTHNPAQQHSANFALKCPRWRTSGQVGGLPLQSCPWRSFRWGIDEPDWTQEEPVVDTLETRDSPTLLPPSPVYRAHITWNHFTLALFYFSLFFFFIKTTESFATSNLSFLPHSYFFSPLSILMYFPNTHPHTSKDYPTKQPMPLVSTFYFSVFLTALKNLDL